MLAGYDYVVVGLFVLSIVIVVVWGKWWLTHLILGSYLLIILTLGLYRSIDTLIFSLQQTPNQTGLFMVSYRWLADFFTNAKLWVIGLVIVLLGWQMLYWSSLGALSNGTAIYRLWQTMQIILAIVIVRMIGMVIWAGPVFFTMTMQMRSYTRFSDPIIRQVVSRLPGILAVHVLLTIIATTVFSGFVDISFSIGRSRRERDAIYVERDEPIRHVME